MINEKAIDIIFELYIELKNIHPEIAKEFIEKTKTDKEIILIYMWLNDELEKNEINSELEKLMTDLFYFIH